MIKCTLITACKNKQKTAHIYKENLCFELLYIILINHDKNSSAFIFKQLTKDKSKSNAFHFKRVIVKLAAVSLEISL